MGLSNCLIEAVKAKIKDPKNVQIIFVWPKMNHGKIHVMWVDRKQNKVLHAYDPRDSKSNRLKVLYKPDYKSKDFKAFQGWYAIALVKRYGIEKAIRIFTKKKFPLVDIKGVLDYAENDSALKSGPELPNVADIDGFFHNGNYVLIIEDNEKGEKKLFSMKTSDAVEYAKDHEFIWKYVTPFDANYYSVGKVAINKLF